MARKKQQASITSTPAKYKIILLVTCIIAITTLAYFPVLKNGFTHWDDAGYVTENPVIRSMALENIKIIFTKSFVGTYQPVVMLLYAFLYKLFQLNPLAYHMLNLLFHLANCILVFWLIYLLSRSMLVSFITSLFFGIHPLHVESVAWVAETKDVVYAFLFLSALIAYLFYEKSHIRRYYFLSFVLFILSLLSKSMSVTLPAVFILVDYFFLNGLTKRKILEKIPFITVGLLFIILTLYTQLGTSLTQHGLPGFSFFRNTALAAHGIIFYLIKLVAPVNLSVLYPYPENFENQMPLSYFVSPVILAVLILLIIKQKKYSKHLLFSSLFFIITIFPVIQFIPVGNAVAADRYTYIPALGLFFLTGMGIEQLYRLKVKLRSVVVMGTIAMTVFWIVQTSQRCRIWADDETIWSDAISQYPHVALAHNNLGLAYMQKGAFEKALSEFYTAIRINPMHEEAYVNLGNFFKNFGMMEKAVIAYKKALKLNSKDWKAHANLGHIYHTMGQFDTARIHYETAVDLYPMDAATLSNLALLYQDKGMKEKAIALYKNAIHYDPGFIPAYLNLGVMYEEKQNYADAVTQYKTVNRIDPSYSEGYFNLGIVYTKMQRMEDAIAEFQKTVFLAPQHASARYYLAEAYLSNGNWKNAVSEMEKAAALDPQYQAEYIKMKNKYVPR